MPTLTLTGDPDADRLLSDNAFALLVGMLLDQQIAMEQAFVGPRRLEERLGRPLTPANLAAVDPDELERLFRISPAVHRYPGSMAKRVHALATTLVERHDGDTEALWREVPDGRTLRERLKDLPGFGDQKARIFVALLGKQCGVTPDGWREAAGDYGQDGRRSIADVVDADTLLEVRAFKQARKAEAKAVKTGSAANG
ncbi:HhH-GPD-type base excision DNA repair protein [Egicoccus halophilus]|uniref:(Fe-S)-cluster assembly protein n=1 Tax=Egicoccus halophilus TaxID=1670830 RepID=A0A8J3EYG5_9ACTN|nr:HhH-GPD-type base excision DNA repair protein [Egicoccus halophilus]GGI07844.1 (Fe-S)-cluster assembly protein [Egicoccus halophilus]